MKLVHTWFSYQGHLTGFDFIVKGFTPGILLGVLAMRADTAFDARGILLFSYLTFSLWPASAMLWKLARSAKPQKL